MKKWGNVFFVAGSMMLALFASVLILIHIETSDPASIILGLGIPLLGLVQ
jgi:hypothetical protein